MKELLDRVSQHYRLYQAEGCSADEVMKAEDRLGLVFPDEYRRYVMRCGAISFGSHELTGLNVDKYVNVVDVTLQERAARIGFPSDCIVVQQLGIEGLIIVQDESGDVYQLDETGNRQRIADSLESYIEMLLPQ